MGLKELVKIKNYQKQSLQNDKSLTSNIFNNVEINKNLLVLLTPLHAWIYIFYKNLNIY